MKYTFERLSQPLPLVLLEKLRNLGICLNKVNVTEEPFKDIPQAGSSIVSHQELNDPGLPVCGVCQV